jgi:PAS domain S-box-containing protein
MKSDDRKKVKPAGQAGVRCKRARDVPWQVSSIMAAVLDSMSEHVVCQDTESRILWTNKAAGDSVGLVLERLVGRFCYAIWQQRNQPCEGCPVVKARETGQPQQSEMTSPDGKIWLIQGIPVRDVNGNITSLIEVTQNITERKRAEGELQEEQKKLKEAQSMGKIGNWEYDVYSQRIIWSDEVYVLYERDPALGPPTMEEEAKYHSADQAKILRDYAARSIETGEEFKYDLEAILPSGEKAVFAASMRPVINESGRVIKLFGTVQDITERKQAEEKVKHLNLVLRAIRNVNQLIAKRAGRDSLLKGACENFVNTRGYYNAWIALLDESGKLVAAAEAGLGKNFQQMIGRLKRGELPDCGRKALKKTGVVVIENPLSACADCPLAKGYPGRGGMSVRLEYGGKVYGLMTVSVPAGIAVEKEEQALFEEVAGDIAFALYSMEQEAERKRAEEVLAGEATRRRILIDQSRDGIVVLDENGKVYEANQRFAELLGYTSKEVRELYVWDWDTQWTREQLLEMVWSVDETGDHFETYHRRKDGTVYDVEISTNGAVVMGQKLVFCVCRDITARKQAEEERRQLEQKAQIASRLASVGEMAAGIAHEINNPLTSVIGYAQLLSDREDIPEDIRMDLKAIDEGAQRVAGIIKRLLTFARQSRPERTLVSINNLITNTLDLRAYHLRTNDIKVTAELATDVPLTMADAAQLQQVFLNIIVNAEAAMKLARGRGKLLIKTEVVNGTIRVSFKDNGPGIANKNLARIFDPFFTTREVDQGTGLGLSICHGIIAEHNGRIWAESKPGSGATFIVELPIVMESIQLEMVEPADKEPKKVPKAKILVVDDEPSTLEFLNRLLTDEGHEVETVSNAAEALEMVKNKRYSLILLDIKMPGASGIELYGRMRKIALSLAERVLFITGDVMGTDTEAFLSRTKAPYITKPFDVNQLKKKIERFLTGGQ